MEHVITFHQIELTPEEEAIAKAHLDMLEDILRAFELPPLLLLGPLKTGLYVSPTGDRIGDELTGRLPSEEVL